MVGNDIRRHVMRLWTRQDPHRCLCRELQRKYKRFPAFNYDWPGRALLRWSRNDNLAGCVPSFHLQLMRYEYVGFPAPPTEFKLLDVVDAGYLASKEKFAFVGPQFSMAKLPEAFDRPGFLSDFHTSPSTSHTSLHQPPRSEIT